MYQIIQSKYYGSGGDEIFHKSGGRSEVHTFSKSSGGENFVGGDGSEMLFKSSGG